MWGAVAGDVIGSVYEAHPIKALDFPLFSPACGFTDDTVLTAATAEVMLYGRDYGHVYREYYKAYPNAGFGAMFHRWAQLPNPQPYFSFGNGSAMRVSPVAWARGSIKEVLDEAHRSASVTHDHPEGIKGAQAVAVAVFMARGGADKPTIRHTLMKHFGYDLERTCDDIRPDYEFDVTCQGSVPESIIAFLDSTDVESAIRNAISLGGDADTMAAIAGSIAEAAYGGVPEPMLAQVKRRLDPPLLETLNAFHAKFMQ